MARFEPKLWSNTAWFSSGFWERDKIPRLKLQLAEHARNNGFTPRAYYIEDDGRDGGTVFVFCSK